MQGYIGLYHGLSTVSWLIRKFSWGPYSHAAYITPSGSVIESWHRGGVREMESIHEGHTPGTVIDCYRIDGMTESQEDVFARVLRSQISKGYDWMGLCGFFRRKMIQNPDLWFCSELLVDRLEYVGVQLFLRILPSQISPSYMSTSPLLELDHIAVV